MENKLCGSISDFGKFVILKHLFNDRKIGVIWYLIPDTLSEEKDKNNLALKVIKDNTSIYEYACSVDKSIAMEFNRILKRDSGKFYIKQLESMEILNNVIYFNKCIVGACPEGRNYREQWLQEALEYTADCEVLYLDPDYGIPFDYRISVLKSIKSIRNSEKYMDITELKEFLVGKDFVVFQNRYPVDVAPEKVHSIINKRLKREFPNKYIYILKQNPFSPRFFTIISRYDLKDRLKKFLVEKNICNVEPYKGFFSLVTEIA